MGHNNQITIKDILSKHDNMYDVSYMFTQPITLIFDGETLKIYENGLELDGYDARSGKLEKRKEIPAKSVNTEDNQTLNTVANEEDNVTQAEEKNNLNLIDDEDSIKKVAYPGVSASATLAQDYNGKYYYYDDKNTTKIPEGEYYILVDEPSKSSSTDNAGTQSNEIIVGEPSKFQDKLGERYIEIYKLSELLFNNEDIFNQSINYRKEETKENFSWFGNRTSYLIHGGKNYEDENGIDLSSNVTTFCKNLATLVSDTYKDKLYKVYGKVPIKLEVKYSRILVLSLNRKWEIQLGKPKSWSTISEYALFCGGKILKDCQGNDIKGYIIEPASKNPVSPGNALSPEEQQKTAGSDTKIPDGVYKVFWRFSGQAFFVHSNQEKHDHEILNNLYNTVCNLYTSIDSIICKNSKCKHSKKPTYGTTHIHIVPELFSDNHIVGSERNKGNREDVLIHYGLDGIWSEGCLLPTDNVDNISFPTKAASEWSTVSAVAKLMDAMINHDPQAFINYNKGKKYSTIENFFINIVTDTNLKIIK